MNAQFNESELKLNLYCLGKDWGTGYSRLEVEFSRASDNELEGVVRLKQFNLDWCHRFGCYGYDLDLFQKELLGLHRGYQPLATFTNMQDSVVLALESKRVPDCALSVSGRVKSIAPEFTVEIPFGGFRSDLSFVPAMVRCIRDFLTVANISVIHPMV